MNKNFYHGAIPSVMTIAGSDSGGGAGIQADLKTFSALRVFGTTAITSITSQNTVGVNDVYNIPIEHLESQMAAVFDDIDIMVVKTGMLATSDIISIVCSTLKKYNVSKLVVDPVMVAKDGSRLLQKQAMSALITELIPISYVITPNIPEAEDLVSMKISNIKDMYNAADKIYKLGAKNVVIKGGHLSGEKSIDVLYDGTEYSEFSTTRVNTTNTHGSGCTFAAAITAFLSYEMPLIDAVKKAKIYVSESLSTDFKVGHGHGPLNHFWGLQFPDLID